MMHRMRRRWLRYSLRTMLIAVLALSVSLAWMANRAAEQRRAVAMVQELGGNVIYECMLREPDENAVYPCVQLVAPWFDTKDLRCPFVGPPCDGPLRQIVGHDWLHDVVEARLVGRDVTDARLSTIVEGFPCLVGITLRDCAITDSGLQHLANLKRLEWIGIDCLPNVISDGVAKLQRRRPELFIDFLPYETIP